MLHSILLITASAVVTGDAHLDQNSVYRELRRSGITTETGQHFTLPAPTMIDGADSDAQQRRLKEIIGNRPLDRFLRNSIVAPHICQLSEIHRDAKLTVRGMDFYFVAYADIERLEKDGFLSRLGDGQDESSGHVLSAEQLAERKINIAESPNLATSPEDLTKSPEAYGHVEFSLFNRIELRVTGRSYWSRTKESLLTASTLDPRFLGDKDFPSQWRGLQQQPDGSREPGDAYPYQGFGSYIKVTRLYQPTGAMLVEGHVIFVEPKAWFDGRNLLKSKLPAIVQNQIRSARREMLKASQSAERNAR